jgi:hypothetical protein
MKYKKNKETKTNKMNRNRKKERKEAEELQLAIEVLNNESTPKYPKGSYIMFGSEKNDENGNPLFCCAHYNKMYFPQKHEYIKHLVSSPPEWQNISEEEATKICTMFDVHTMMRLNYVAAPIWEREE